MRFLRNQEEYILSGVSDFSKILNSLTIVASQRSANTVNIVKKLVMVFAEPYLDSELDNETIQSSITLQRTYFQRKNQPHATGQIPRHTCLAPGLCQGLPGQGTGRLLRQVTFPNHIAVPLGKIDSVLT